MSESATPTLVIVPGLRGHVEEHWQSRLAARTPGALIVDSSRRPKLDLAGRVQDLQDVVESVAGPVLLVAHSAGVLITVHWANQHPQPSSVVGALLATPPDLVNPLPAEYPSLDELGEAGWLPIPRARLPFAGLVAISSNDPLSAPANIAAFAADWGADTVDVGAVGHLNPAAGYGEWARVGDLLATLADHANRSTV